MDQKVNLAEEDTRKGEEGTETEEEKVVKAEDLISSKTLATWFILLLFGFLIIFLGLCAVQEIKELNKEEGRDVLAERFVVTAETEECNSARKVLSATKLYVDKETGVQYLWHSEEGVGGMVVLVDEDGKPILSETEE